MSNATHIFEFTDEQLGAVVSSLQSSIRRAEEKAAEAVRKDLHDAKTEEAFYVGLQVKYRDALNAIERASATQDEGRGDDEEDVCSECGEDHGFCQCEED